MGFDQIDDEVLKHLVVARISQPLSKAATVEYLKSYFDEDVELHKIYRYLDKLHSTQQEKIQQISVEHTRRILGGKIGIVFYDVTTLYFETDDEDELRGERMVQRRETWSTTSSFRTFGKPGRLSFNLFVLRWFTI